MQENKDLKKISKFLSYVLRHHPELIGITLDEQGWTDVPDLIKHSNNYGIPLSEELLIEVVTTNSKQRFSFNAQGDKIRASQGHSVTVDLGYEPAVPPEMLYHGTTGKFFDAIRSEGIQKMDRTHVHLSAGLQTALEVGRRHGKPIILEIMAGKMHEAGFQFFLSANGVWLTDTVPVGYFRVLS